MDIQPTSSDSNRSAPFRPSRRTMLSLALGAVLGGLPGALVAAKPQPPRAGRRQRRPRFKVVTRTFTSSVPLTIPAEGPASVYPSTLRVGGLRAGTITDVNVTLSSLSHAAPGEFEVVLVAPNGVTSVVLMSDAGGQFDVTNVTLVFDDQAASYLPFDAQIVSGAFKPRFPGQAPRPDAAALRAFTGLNPNGTWRLYAADSDNGNQGSLAGWALTIRARVRR